MSRHRGHSLLRRCTGNGDILGVFYCANNFSICTVHNGTGTIRSISDDTGTVRLAGRGVTLGFPNSPHRRTFYRSTFGCLSRRSRRCSLVVLSPPTFTGRHTTLHGTLGKCAQLGMGNLREVGGNKVLFAFDYSRIMAGSGFHGTIFATTTRTKEGIHVLRRLRRPTSRPVGVCRPRNRCLGKLILCIRWTLAAWGRWGLCIEMCAVGGMRWGCGRRVFGRSVSNFDASTKGNRLQQFATRTATARRAKRNPAQRRQPNFTRNKYSTCTQLPSNLSNLQKRRLPRTKDGNASLSLRYTSKLQCDRHPGRNEKCNSQPNRDYPPTRTKCATLLSYLCRSMLTTCRRPRNTCLKTRTTIERSSDRSPSFYRQLSLGTYRQRHRSRM